MNKERLLRIARKVEAENDKGALKFFELIRDSDNNLKLNSPKFHKFREEVWKKYKNGDLTDEYMREQKKYVKAFMRAFGEIVGKLKKI